MRVLLQRVSQARVDVDGKTVGEIGIGLMLLVGVTDSDGEADSRKMAQKVANMRIFADETGRFNDSLLDIGGGALVVSQFTLFADVSRGRRPSFSRAARPDHAEPLIGLFASTLTELGVQPVAHGVFGASMRVSLCNEGPVTIWVDSEDLVR